MFDDLSQVKSLVLYGPGRELRHTRYILEYLCDSSSNSLCPAMTSAREKWQLRKHHLRSPVLKKERCFAHLTGAQSTVDVSTHPLAGLNIHILCSTQRQTRTLPSSSMCVLRAFLTLGWFVRNVWGTALARCARRQHQSKRHARCGRPNSRSCTVLKGKRSSWSSAGSRSRE